MFESVAHFHFLRPYGLLALLLLPLLLTALRHLGAATQTWGSAVDAHLLRHLLIRGTGAQQKAPRWLVALAWIIATVALAGPAWEQLPQPLYRNRAAYVIALELAPTMLAGDLKPTRLERARFKIADILQRSKDTQTALIAYAGEPFVVAPLTDDANTVANLVDALDPSVMPVAGNDTGRAIDKAVQLIQQAGLNGGNVLLIADSVSDNAIASAKRANAAGVRVSVLAMGTTQGAPVALPQGGFLQDASGNIVLPRLNAEPLQAVTVAGGGDFAVFVPDSSDLDRLLGSIPLREAGQTDASLAATARFRDRGPWLLLLLLPLAAAGFRRGWVLLLPFCLVLSAPSAQAFGWNDLWQRADQQAWDALKAGDAKAARHLAQDPRLRGTADYRDGDFPAAAQEFSTLSDADGKYNLGNALAKQGRYPEALAAYDQALALKPDMEDARANKQAIEDWLRQQKQQQQDQQNKQEQKNDKDSQQNQQSQADQNQDQSKKNQSSADQKSDSGSPQSSESSKPDQPEAQKKDAAKEQESNDQNQAESQASAKPEEKQAKQQFQKDMNQALKQDPEKKPDEHTEKMAAKPTDAPPTEQQQAMKQWLERVPDDPGGLLRRKFQLEHQRRQGRGAAEEDGQ